MLMSQDWSNNGSSETELRLDNAMYKAYINNEPCTDWHYSNWAILPELVQILELEVHIAVLHVKRTKTVLATEELWVRFENNEVLSRFMATFVSTIFFTANQIVALDP